MGMGSNSGETPVQKAESPRRETLRVAASRAPFPVAAITRSYPTISLVEADLLSENVIGVATAPVTWAEFKLSGKSLQLPFLEPLSTEISEAVTCLSVATMHREDTFPIVQAQIQLISPLPDFPIGEMTSVLEVHQAEWQEIAERAIPGMVNRGGGPCGFHLAIVEGLGPDAGSMAILTLDVNVCDAMGANCLNTVSEAVSEKITEALPSDVRLGMRILTNACPTRRVSLILDFPDSVEMMKLKNNWDTACAELSQTELLYPFAKGMTDVAKVTANDSRAVVAALTYDLHVLGNLPLEMGRTASGFQIKVDVPAPFGSVGRLSRFPCAVEALKQMAVSKSSDIACHAAISGVIHTLAWLQTFTSTEQTASESGQSGDSLETKNETVAVVSPHLPKLHGPDMDVLRRRQLLESLLGEAIEFQSLTSPTSTVVAEMSLPVGVIPNLVLNDRMMHLLAVTEEPSVVAGTSFGTKLISHGLNSVVTRREGFFDMTLHTKIPVSALSRGPDYPGEKVRDAVVAACAFANACPERATTNNKGFDNGMAAAAMALGWDDVLLSLAMHESAKPDPSSAAGANGIQRAPFENLRGQNSVAGLALSRHGQSQSRLPEHAPRMDVAKPDPSSAAGVNGIQRAKPFENNYISGSAKPNQKYGAIVQWRVAPDGDLVGHCKLSIPFAALSKLGAFSSTAIAEKILPGVIEDQLSAVVAAGMGVHLASLIALGTKGIQANHMGFHSR